jgi:hypothetical protein
MHLGQGNRPGTSPLDSHLVGAGEPVDGHKFMLHSCYTTITQCWSCEGSGWKDDYISNWGDIYNSVSVYIVMPCCCNQVASAWAMRLLTDPSALTLCFISASALLHSFPINTDLDARSLLGDPSSCLLIVDPRLSVLSDILLLSSVIDGWLIPSFKPGGK